MKHRVALFAAALWWGSLTTIGAVVVPLLFMHLATPAIAGAMAAKLFTAQSWISVGCCMLLLLTTLNRHDDEDSVAARPEARPAPAAVLPVLAGLLLALLIEYAVAPRIVARENLQLWHSLGTLMFVLQWVCASAIVWRQARTD